ncbi:hypothetical protein NFI96_024530 [Prochilodus magdalenae]|nr:hypothetical protein NFI96_024530 [Prochilodus magdalenae]
MAARSVSFDADAHFMEGLESPLDEDRVHDSFTQLIEEQSQDLTHNAEVIEMSSLDLEEETRDDVPSLSGGGSCVGVCVDGAGGEMDPLMENCWSTATLKVLSSMPSRTIDDLSPVVLNLSGPSDPTAVPSSDTQLLPASATAAWHSDARVLEMPPGCC